MGKRIESGTQRHSKVGYKLALKSSRSLVSFPSCQHPTYKECIRGHPSSMAGPQSTRPNTPAGLIALRTVQYTILHRRDAIRCDANASMPIISGSTKPGVPKAPARLKPPYQLALSPAIYPTTSTSTSTSRRIASDHRTTEQSARADQEGSAKDIKARLNLQLISYLHYLFVNVT